ncbi:MAG: hypothetical protein IPP61_02930 [Cytophagaceae bacterium]|nr:hypothetical protein [Cytophagaceae bacterium]MBL0301310.1 hypothetical protein [Cytophagaceae bacterium]MBL0324127.1 hypothetical protein [Cytophagaceae bacterium]
MLKNKTDFQTVIVFFLFCYAFFSLFFPLSYARHGIDASWVQAIALSIESGKIFGKDFIFNYGPLGFLYTGLLPKGFSPYIIFVYHCFLLFNFYFLIREIITAFKKVKWLSYLLPFLFIYPSGFFADATFALMFFAVFWQNSYLNSPSYFKIILFTIIIVLILPIKLNLSLIALVYYFTFLAFSAISRKGKPMHYLASVVVFISGILFISNTLKFDLYSSLFYSADIISAYQDSMSFIMVDDFEYVFFLILAVVSGLSFIFTGLSKFRTLHKNFFLLFWVGILWFLSYKQGYTAYAKGNLSAFLTYLVPLSILIYIFSKEINPKILLTLVLISISIKTAGSFYIRYTDYAGDKKAILKSYFNYKPKLGETFTEFLLKIPITKNPLPYFSELFQYDYDKNFRENPCPFPDRILKKVGNNDADVIPWDISYLFFNKIKYENRPVIQSYQANSKLLMEVNGDKYWSAEKPHFVIANLKPFREQNNYWTDTWCHASLYYNYELTDTFSVKGDSLYLFENKSGNSRFLPKNLVSSNATLDQKILIPKSEGLLFIKANIKYDLMGTVMKTFFQPPYLRCEVETIDNQKSTYRIPVSILAGGVLISHKIDHNHEFYDFHKFRGKKNAMIKSVKFYSEKGKGLKENFDYTIFSI